MDGPRFRTMRQSSGVKGSFVCLKDLSKLCFLHRALSDPCRAPSPHLCQEIGSALLDVSKSLLVKYIKQNHTKYKYETKCIIKCTTYETCNVFLEAKSEDNLAKRVYMSMCMSLKSRSQTFFDGLWWNDFHPVRKKIGFEILTRSLLLSGGFSLAMNINEQLGLSDSIDPLWLEISVKSSVALELKTPCRVYSSSARSARTTHFSIHRLFHAVCPARHQVVLVQKKNPSRLSIDLLQCLLQFSSLWCLAGDVACCGCSKDSNVFFHSLLCWVFSEVWTRNISALL